MSVAILIFVGLAVLGFIGADRDLDVNDDATGEHLNTDRPIRKLPRVLVTRWLCKCREGNPPEATVCRNCGRAK